jgi:MFS transporter, DHA1 family, tetracycline resistance protein
MTSPPTSPAAASALGPAQMRIAIAIVFVDSIGFGILAPVIPFLMLEMGAGVILVTQLIALHRLAGFLCSPAIGRLSDRFGRIRTIRWSIVASIAAFIGMFFSISLLGFFVFRTLTGALTGRDAVVRALATDGVPQDAHARVLGGLAGAAAIGVIVGPALTAVLSLIIVGRADLYRAVVALNIVLLAATLIALTRARRPEPPQASVQSAAATNDSPTVEATVQTPPVGGSYAAADLPVAVRTIAVPLIIAFLVTYAYGVLIAATGLLALARFGWTEIGTAWLLGAGALLVGVARMVVMPRTIDRFGMAKAMALAVLIAAPAFFVLGVATNTHLFTIAFIIYALAGGVAVLMPTVFVSQSAPPRQRGQFLGAAEAAGALALFVSASSSGFLFSWIAPSAPYVFGAIGLLLCLPLLFAFARQSRAVPIGGA